MGEARHPRIRVARMVAMHERMLEWNDLRFCLALARCGNLTAAARELGVTQPTVGRRLKALEDKLGTILFSRHPDGFVPTETGRAVVAQAATMERAATTAEHLATARDIGVAGTVRVTASEWLVDRVLAPAVAPFMARHPNIVVELVADARWLSILRRDADLAIRPVGFEHRDVVQRELAEVAFGLYASDSYLAAHGTPDFAGGCPDQRIITMIRADSPITDLAWLDDVASRARVVARCNGRQAQAAMASQGIGIACLPRLVGDAHPELRLLDPPEPPPSRTLRIGLHHDARTVPRIRHLIDFLVEAFDGVRELLAPPER